MIGIVQNRWVKSKDILTLGSSWKIFRSGSGGIGDSELGKGFSKGIGDNGREKFGWGRVSLLGFSMKLLLGRFRGEGSSSS